jgi:hypothetical protein
MGIAARRGVATTREGSREQRKTVDLSRCDDACDAMPTGKSNKIALKMRCGGARNKIVLFA